MSQNVDFGDAFAGARAAPRRAGRAAESANKAFLRGSFPALALRNDLGRLFDRFACARVERSGSVSSLNLSSHALGLHGVVAKRFLRRFNLNALPQLLNVISGEMSLVVPRPHALAHDQLFERRIALYARRHNVKTRHYRLGAGKRPARRGRYARENPASDRPRSPIYRQLVANPRHPDTVSHRLFSQSLSQCGLTVREGRQAEAGMYSVSLASGLPPAEHSTCDSNSPYSRLAPRRRPSGVAARGRASRRARSVDCARERA